MTQFRRLLESGEDELVRSLLAATQEDAPPPGSLLRASAAVGIPAALLAAPASASITGLVVPGMATGSAGMAAIAAATGSVASTGLGSASTAGVAGVAGTLPSGLFPVTLGALLKPFAIGVLGGAFALGTVQFVMRAAGPQTGAPREMEQMAANGSGRADKAAPRGVARSAVRPSVPDPSGLTPSSNGPLNDPTARDREGEPSDSSTQLKPSAAALALNSPALSARSKSSGARSRQGAKDATLDGSDKELAELTAAQAPATTPEGAPEAVPPPVPSVVEPPKKPGASALAAEIALIDQARTALLTRKPERVLALLAEYRGTSFAPEAEKLRAQALELIRQRSSAEPKLLP